jgi:heme exporter protein A
MIKIAGLSKSFGSFYALREVSLEIQSGEFWMIVGPNGAGKTTLLKIIATLSQPSRGKIQIDAVRVEKAVNYRKRQSENSNLPPIQQQQAAKVEAGRLQIRQQIGFIGHQSFLYDNLTAEENLKFYTRMYRLENAAERIAHTLERVGLSERKSDLVRTFSRGMQQRLSIGRALLANPKIILLDEPFSGLDQSAIDNFIDLFSSLISPDRIIIMTTHNLQIGLQLASHYAVITRGKIIARGLSQETDYVQFKELYKKLTGEVK